MLFFIPTCIYTFTNILNEIRAWWSNNINCVCISVSDPFPNPSGGCSGKDEQLRPIILYGCNSFLWLRYYVGLARSISCLMFWLNLMMYLRHEFCAISAEMALAFDVFNRTNSYMLAKFQSLWNWHNQYHDLNILQDHWIMCFMAH